MDISRRDFLGTTAGAAALAALGTPVPAAAAEDDPLGTRKDFPGLRQFTFLNTAYMGLIPQAVWDAGRDWLESCALRPSTVPQWLAKMDEARKLFAGMVGAGEDEIGFLSSTTEGENVVVNSLEFKPGDNIVFDDLVYPSTPVIYDRLRKTKGVELRVVRHRNGVLTLEDFKKLVDDRTRLVSVAWVSNLNGYLHDIKGLADLAHAHGAYLYADAVQKIGTGPVDAHALGVDFFTAGTYKWLMSGFGVAPFYVRRDLLDRIQPINVGWRVEKRLENYEYQHFRTAKKFEYATQPFGEMFQLVAGLTYLRGIGLDRIQAQSLALAGEFRQGLADRKLRIFTPEGNRSAIVSFYIKKSQEEAGKILEAEKMKVSLQNGERTEAEGPGPITRVRVAFSFFNNSADVQRMLSVAEKLSAT